MALLVPTRWDGATAILQDWFGDGLVQRMRIDTNGLKHTDERIRPEKTADGAFIGDEVTFGEVKARVLKFMDKGGDSTFQRRLEVFRPGAKPHVILSEVSSHFALFRSPDGKWLAVFR